MPQNLKIVYSVLPNAAALARRAAEFFVVEAETGCGGARRGANRDQRRVNAEGGVCALGERGEEWRERMPWEKLDLWWVDERCVPPDNAESNYRMTREALLDHVPLKPEQIHRMKGELEPDDAAAQYEAELRNELRAATGRRCHSLIWSSWAWVRMDTLRLFFPHTEALHETKRLVTANYVEKLDMWRVTLTRPVINHARQVFFLISGADKAHDSK